MRTLITTSYIGFFLQLIGHVDCSVSCNFDKDMCGWTSEGSSKYSWTTHSGESTDRTSGPINDVTCNNSNGYYAYLPGIYSSKDIRTEMGSETVTLNIPSVFTFWYFMTGVGIGSLTVVQKFDNDTSLEVWSKHGEQGKGWQQARTNLIPGTFTVTFRGSVVLPYGSDLAIDDVVLESENIDFDTSYCSRTTTTTLSSTHTTEEIKSTQTNQVTKAYPTRTLYTHVASSSTTLTTYSSVCSVKGLNSPLLPGSCDFETNTCDLDIRENEQDKEVSWERRNKGTQFLKMSIQHDHTYQNDPVEGYFLSFRNKVRFLRLDRPLIGRNASVETPLYNDTVVCLSFWYIMTTKDSNLLVYTKDVAGKTLDRWKSETITSAWSMKQITIQSAIPFRIGFQTRNKNFQAFVGLDDIEIKAGSTHSTQKITTTTSSDISSPIPTVTAMSPVSSDIKTYSGSSAPVSTPLSPKHALENKLSTKKYINTVSYISIDGKTDSNAETTSKPASSVQTRTSSGSSPRRTTTHFITSAEKTTEQTKSSSLSVFYSRHGSTVPPSTASQIIHTSTHNSSNESQGHYTHKPTNLKISNPATIAGALIVQSSNKVLTTPVSTTPRTNQTNETFSFTEIKGPTTLKTKPTAVTGQSTIDRLSTSSKSTTSPHNRTNETIPFTSLEASTRQNTLQNHLVSSSSTTPVRFEVTDKQSDHKHRNSTVVIGYSVGTLVFITLIALVIYFISRSRRQKKATKRYKEMLNSNGTSPHFCFDSTHRNGKVADPKMFNQNESNNISPECVNETDISTKF